MSTSRLGRSALGTVDIVVSQGSDTTYRFRWLTGDPAVGVDLTGFTGAGKISARAGSVALGEFTVECDASGNVVATLPKEETLYPRWGSVPYDRAVYDIELTSPAGETTRLVEGKVTISRSVTSG